MVRQRLAALYAEERIRGWTNQRVRAAVRAGGTPGPAASIGKVHQGRLNQSLQMLAADLLGADALAWARRRRRRSTAWTETLPYEVAGMLRSRANTIEGGTTEVNKNVLGEKVLGLPREPDPYHDAPWDDGAALVTGRRTSSRCSTTIPSGPDDLLLADDEVELTAGRGRRRGADACGGAARRRRGARRRGRGQLRERRVVHDDDVRGLARRRGVRACERRGHPSPSGPP